MTRKTFPVQTNRVNFGPRLTISSPSFNQPQSSSSSSEKLLPSFNVANFPSTLELNADWRRCDLESFLPAEQCSQPSLQFLPEEKSTGIYCLLRVSSRISAPLLLLKLLISDLIESSAAFTSAHTDLSQLFRRLTKKWTKSIKIYNFFLISVLWRKQHLVRWDKTLSPELAESCFIITESHEGRPVCFPRLLFQLWMIVINETLFLCLRWTTPTTLFHFLFYWVYSLMSNPCKVS